MPTGKPRLPRPGRLLLAALLLLAAGCTAADKEQWDAAMRDARGDNMQLRYERSMMGGENMGADKR